ncbi:hypothetical protein O181_001459 [Austropuccinia psidii MF-1]|uniref:Uncharacterized protein n=1 Tax=Austropuccinia psidii MF-1 TaxID=1389203 RepID=A0A9Q3BAK2_9BASI|nr:hypothetical protein [Austropuccinia psidii MF-1]
MLPQIHQGVMSSWNILKKFRQEEEIVRYSNGWNPLSSKSQIKKIKDWHNTKREARKEEAPVASTSKPKVVQPPQEGRKNKKRTGGNHKISKLQDPKNPKECHVQCLGHG